MSGRWILTLMIVSSFLMAGLFYVALRKAPEYRQIVLEKVQTELTDYTLNVKKLESLPVAQVGEESYFVKTQPAWKVDLIDKLLLIQPPMPVSENGQPLPADQLPAARKSVEDFVWSWLDEKFNKDRKNLQVEVRFEGEPATASK